MSEGRVAGDGEHLPLCSATTLVFFALDFGVAAGRSLKLAWSTAGCSSWRGPEDGGLNWPATPTGTWAHQGSENERQKEQVCVRAAGATFWTATCPSSSTHRPAADGPSEKV